MTHPSPTALEEIRKRSLADDAATPAIALCIAALKARQASSTPSDQSPAEKE